MWESYTMYVQTKSLYGNRYAQFLSNGTFFADIYPVDRKSDAGITLKTFITQIGVSERLTIGGAKDQNSPGTYYMKFFRSNDTQVTRTEPERPNHNPEEVLIW